jgi:hypothetical protein
MKSFALPIVTSLAFSHDQHHVLLAPDVRVGRRDGDGFVAVGLHFGASLGGPRGYGSFIPECAWLRGVAGDPTFGGYGQQSFLAAGEQTFSCSFGVSAGPIIAH